MEEQPRKATRKGGRQPGAGRKVGDKHELTVLVSSDVKRIVERRKLPGEQAAYIEACVLFFEAHLAASRFTRDPLPFPPAI